MSGKSALLVVVLCSLFACDRPRTVAIDVSGAQNLTLRGKSEVTGTLRRSVENVGRVVEKGTAVVVQETWLVRREKSDPPAYRIVGHYDPSAVVDGFSLPAGSLDVYYLSVVLPDRVVPVVVPIEELVRDEAAPR